jgi:outer membrane lipase/esterase
VTVNGFDEGGNLGSAALRLHEQKRRSEVWSAGLRASMDLGGWTPWARVTADKERRDDERMVSATPLTLAAIGNRYDVPAYTSDSTFTTASLGVNGWIMPRLGLSVGYFRVSGRSGIREDGASALLSYHF